MDENAKLLLEKEAESQIEKVMKKESFYLKFRSYIPSVILAGLWVVLGLLRNMGMQLGIFKVLNFFTGAVNGLTGNVIGGAIGKALLLVCVNTFFREMIISEVGTKEKLKMLGANLKDSLLGMIPMFKELKSIIDLKQTKYIVSALLGAAAGIAVYPFITSDGSLVNSMVLFMLAVTLFKQLKKNKGLFMIGLHWFFSLFKNADKKMADAVVTGISSGFAFSLLIAVTGEIPESGLMIRRNLTLAILAILIVGSVVSVVKNKKTEVKEEA